MRTAGLPEFRKLWGRIPEGLEAGTYRVYVKSNYNVEPFSGQKSFVISTTNNLGGKNNFLACCFYALGIICFLYTICFIVAVYKKKGDAKASH